MAGHYHKLCATVKPAPVTCRDTIAVTKVLGLIKYVVALNRLITIEMVTANFEVGWNIQTTVTRSHCKVFLKEIQKVQICYSVWLVTITFLLL